MTTVNDILSQLNEIAPMEMKMDFDNIGLLVGRTNAETSRILISLDITHDVISEAHEIGAKLIISHHPIFYSLKNITDTDITGLKVIRLIENGISAICMHTNLDAAMRGTSYALAKAAGLVGDDSEFMLLAQEGFLGDGTAFSYGRSGYLQSAKTLSEYLPELKSALKTNGIRYYDCGKDVYHVAVVSGSGGDYLEKAMHRGCDTLLTADIKYDVFLEAKELGMNIIDGDHFCTENLVTENLAMMLRPALPSTDITVSSVHAQTVKFF